jgi:hypothetical protein
MPALQYDDSARRNEVSEVWLAVSTNKGNANRDCRVAKHGSWKISRCAGDPQIPAPLQTRLSSRDLFGDTQPLRELPLFQDWIGCPNGNSLGFHVASAAELLKFHPILHLGFMSGVVSAHVARDERTVTKFLQTPVKSLFQPLNMSELRSER